MHTCSLTYIRAHVRYTTYMCTDYAYNLTYTYTHIYTHTYIYIYIYTTAHTHKHIRTRAHSCPAGRTSAVDERRPTYKHPHLPASAKQ